MIKILLLIILFGISLPLISQQRAFYGFIKNHWKNGNKILQYLLSEKFIMLTKSIIYYGH